jgi:hypothetical protein
MRQFDSRYRLRTVENVTLNPVSGDFKDILVWNDAGFFESALLNFSKEKVLLRGECDGEELFNLDLKQLQDNIKNPEYMHNLAISLDNSENGFLVKPSQGIVFTDSFKIQAKSSEDKSNRKASFGICEIVEYKPNSYQDQSNT